MAIDFPSSPTTGQVYTYAGVTYTYTAQGVWAITQQLGRAGFSAYQSTSQTGLASEGITKVTFTTTLFNDSSLYDTGTSRWTPPSGRCQMSSAVGLVTGLIGTPAIIFIHKNGAVFRMVHGATVSSTQSGVGISVIDSCNGADYYEVYIFAFASTTFSTLGASQYTWFMGSSI